MAMARSTQFGRPGVALLAYLLWATAASGQDVEKTKPWAFLSVASDEKADANPTALAPNLRPNVAQKLNLYVRNPTDSARPVKVELRINDAAVAATGRVNVNAGQTSRVALPKAPPAAPPAAGAKGAPEDKGMPLPRRDGRYGFVIRVIDDTNGQVLNDSVIRFDIQKPLDYVDATGEF